MSVQRRKYDPDFKRNAVSLAEEPGRTVIEIAGNFSISKGLLYKWRHEFHLREGLAFWLFPGLRIAVESRSRIC